MIRLPSQGYNRRSVPYHPRVRVVNYISSVTEMELMGVSWSVNTRLCSSDCKNCPWVDFKDYEECGLHSVQHGPI